VFDAVVAAKHDSVPSAAHSVQLRAETDEGGGGRPTSGPG